MSGPPKATFDDLLKLPADARVEIIDGDIVERTGPSFEHANAQTALVTALRTEFHGRGGGDRTGGWWIVGECDVELEAHQVYVPDLVGWRRDRLPELPSGRPITLRPDWVCEILSPSNAANDTIKKFRGYHRAGVSHYWIVDPRDRSLIVYRHHADGYLATAMAGIGDTIRAEPFAAIELRVSVLFGEED